MRPDDLHSFISLLEQADELVRVPALVDPHLELAAVIDRVCKGAARRRALLFEQVKGSELPVAANLFGTPQRVAWALGTTDLTGLAERLAGDLAATGAGDAAGALARLLGDPAWQPELHPSAAWLEHDGTARGFEQLPALQAWPGDGGRYLTLGQVFTKHPETDELNCGMYRVQLLDRTTAALNCRPGSDAEAHLAAWHARGQAAPVAIALGGPPALTWAAGVPLPPGAAEAALVGYLTGRPLAVTRVPASDLFVPTSAEVVILGEVRPGETAAEGPFGNHTGRYVPAAHVPRLRLSRIYRRARAICPYTLVGPPPMEDLALAAVTAQLLLPLLQYDHPWVEDVHLPREGIFHRAGLVAVRDRERPLAELAPLLWRSRLLRDARLLVLLDAAVDLRQPAEVYWRAVNCPDWSRHLLVDGGRLVIDARRPKGSRAVAPDPAVLERVLSRWHEFNLD